jgi:hypothetical protein
MNASVKNNTNTQTDIAYNKTSSAFAAPFLAQTPLNEQTDPLKVKSWTGAKPDLVKTMQDVIIDAKGKKITVSFPLYKDNNLNFWKGYFTLDRFGKRVDFEGVPESAASTDARINTITNLVKTGWLGTKNIKQAAFTTQTSAQRHDQAVNKLVKKGFGIDYSNKTNSVKSNYNLGISFAVLEMLKNLFEGGESAKNLTTDQKKDYTKQIQASIDALKVEARKQGYNDKGWASALGNAGFNLSTFFMLGETAIGPVLSKLGQIPRIGKGITVAAAVAGLAGAGDQLKSLVLELGKGDKADKAKLLNDLGNTGLLAYGLKGLIPKKSKAIAISKPNVTTTPRTVPLSMKQAQQMLQTVSQSSVGTRMTKGGIAFERVFEGVRITEIATGKSRFAAIKQPTKGAATAKRSDIDGPASKPTTAQLAASNKPKQKALPPAKQDKGGAIVLAAKSGVLVTPNKIKMPTSIKLVPMAGVNNIVTLPQRETTTLHGRTIFISRHNGKTTARVNGETIDIPANVSAKNNSFIAKFALTKHQSMQTKDLPRSTPSQIKSDLDALKQIGIDHQNSPEGQQITKELQKAPTMMAKDVSGESAEGGDGSFGEGPNTQSFEPPKEIRLYTEGCETIPKNRKSAIYAKVKELEFDTVLGKTVEQLFSKAMNIFKKYNRAEKEAFVALLKDNLVTRNSLINSPSFVNTMKEQRIKSLDKNGSGDVKLPTINTVLLPITDHPFDITNHRSRMPEELVAINFHAVFNDPSIGSFNRTNYPNGINDDFRNNANSGYQPFYRYGSDMVNSPEVFLNLDEKILDRLKNVALSDKERKIISRVMFNFNSPAEAQFAKLSELFDFTANENRTIVNLLRMLPKAKIEIMRQYVLKKMIEKHSGFIKDIFQDIPPVKHAKYDEQYVNILIKHMKDTVLF